MKLKQNKQSKLVVALSAVILLLVALSATLTFAYFTATTGESSSGEIDFGNLTLTASNNGGVSFSSDNQNGVKFQPGDTITVKGKTVLSSNIDAYYRVKMDVAIYTKDNSGNKNSSAMTICNNTETGHLHGKNCLTVNELNLIKDTFFKKMKADGTVDETSGTKGLQISLTELTEHNGYYYGLKGKDDPDKTIFDYTSDGETDNGVTITLDATKFGNWWQDKIVVINIQVEAIQALHLQKTTDDTVTNLTEGISKQIVADSTTSVGESQIKVSDLASADAWNTIANDGVKSN